VDGVPYYEKIQKNDLNQNRKVSKAQLLFRNIFSRAPCTVDHLNLSQLKLVMAALGWAGSLGR
jgi:hypothetical protein